MTDESAQDLVQYECQDNIARITLNRPDKLNAFNDDLVRALGDALRRFDADPEAFTAIICGNGRAFSSGADVHQRQMRTRDELERLGGPQGFGAHSADLLTKSVNWKPVIAAVHGYVLGLAIGIVFECDLVVAEEGTKFQITELSRGLGSSKYWGLLQFRGGAAFATEVAMTGRFFDAQEAHQAGLINRVTANGSVMDVAYELAGEINKNPPLSVRATVRTRRWYMDQLGREIMMQVAPLKLYLSEDFREAATAFVEKRPAGPFKGR